jgi:hypothetical protein
MSYMPLLPFWILGFPMLIALVDLMRTPRATRPGLAA